MPCGLRVITSMATKEFVCLKLMRNKIFVAVLAFFILKSAIYNQSRKNRAFLTTQESPWGVNELQLCRLLDLALGGASELTGCNFYVRTLFLNLYPAYPAAYATGTGFLRSDCRFGF